MRRTLAVVLLLFAGASSVHARGLMIPDDKSLPPLAMLTHQVTITLEDQVAVTRVEQTFRNHTDRPLEATYIFPVPRGASVSKFSMWINDKEVPGELVEAKKARAIYTSIVRRTQDPALLEYIDNNLMRLRVFPIPAHGDQKVALTFSSVLQREGDVIEYIYPLKTDGKATSTLEKFSIEATLKSQHAIQNVYSPTHGIGVQRVNDREVKVRFQRDQAILDRDFQLLYTLGKKDVGLTALTHRPTAGSDGYFLLLISPRAELPRDQIVPRDMVLVLDTSGSMAGAKMEQARKALKYCLDNLGDKDRFAVLNFATSVNTYGDGLTTSSKDNVAQAKRWVDGLQATGGTAIDDALQAALAMRTGDTSRSFTIVFFTDGEPTVGECKPDAILKNVLAKNTANTRIFTFGVGDDVNANLLDRLATQTRAAVTYVRPVEDIEVKVSSLYSKISQPVLVNLSLSASNVHLTETFPPRLPDLFHGGQVMVLGRYSGSGPTTIKLKGTVGKDTREFSYDVAFPDKTNEERAFVEQVWARRKVGYLLDQIRTNGEKKELVDETIALAKKYGIATPYTSYLIVPDGPVPVAGAGLPGGATSVPAALPPLGDRPAMGTIGFAGQIGFGGQFGLGGQIGQFGLGGQIGQFGGISGGCISGGGLTPLGGQPGFAGGQIGKPVPQGILGASGQIGQFGALGQLGGFGGGQYGTGPTIASGSVVAPVKVTDFARQVQNKPGESEANRGKIEDDRLRHLPGGQGGAARLLEEAKQKKASYDRARESLARNQTGDVQVGKLGVDLSVDSNLLRNQSRLALTPVRRLAGRNCLEIGGVWIDQEFDAKMTTVTVKAMSEAYFTLLQRQPQLKELFQLGNYLVWVTPSGTALVIDLNDGKEKLSDAEMDKLFVATK